MNELASMMAELTLAGLEKRKPNIRVIENQEKLIKMAREQHLGYLWLVPAINAGLISKELTGKANSMVMHGIARTLNQVMRYQELHNAFEKNEIRNLPVKGILLKNIYPSKEMREMGDIDILVYPEDQEKCRELMPKLGYELVEDKGNHEIVYLSPEGVNVEIHKELYAKECDTRQHDYFCDRSKDRLMDGCNYSYEYSLNDLYIYIMAHAARHFYSKGFGVRGLIDIYVYRNVYGSKMDNEYIYAELEKLGICTFTKHMERASDIWLRGEKSNELYDNIIEYMLNFGAYGSDANGIWSKFSRSNNVNDGTKGMRKNYYFPPINYLSEYYPVLKKVPILLPFIWVKRGLNGIAKKGSGQRAHLVATMDENTIRKMAQIYDSMEMDFREDDD